jgi:hemerythrin
MCPLTLEGQDIPTDCIWRTDCDGRQAMCLKKAFRSRCLNRRETFEINEKGTLMSADATVNLWKPEYLLDIASMDGQHKYFFQILEVVSKLSNSTDRTLLKNSHITKITTELRRYSQRHFYDEEVMLEKHKYPGLLAQCSEHDKYQMYVLDFINTKIGIYSLIPEDIVSEETIALLKELAVFIASWWDDHILKNDFLYVDHVRSSKKRKT